jgi:hypothetical protein
MRLLLQVLSCRADRSFERAYAYLANPGAEHEAETKLDVHSANLLRIQLEIVGKRLKLTRDRLVGHGLGSAEQSLCCL